MKPLLAALLLATASAPALAIDPPATVLQNTVEQDGLLPVHVDRRGGRIICCRCRRPTRTGFRGASSMSPRSRPGSARRRSGWTAAFQRLAAARLPPGRAQDRRRDRKSALPRHRPGRRRAGGRAPQLRLFDDLDGRYRRRDAGRAAARRHLLLPHPRRPQHRPRAPASRTMATSGWCRSSASPTSISSTSSRAISSWRAG